MLTVRRVLVGGAPHTLAMVEDISARKSLERQVLVAQRMDALGRLAGGVAHDFNNLLTVIISFAGFARDALGRDDPRREDIVEVLRAADSAASLTDQLLIFSRRTKVEPRVVDLNDLLLDLDKMLRRLIGESVEFVWIPREDLWPVRIDPRQLEQVVVNLAVNARDAMPGGGTLTIGLENITASGCDRVALPTIPPGDYVRLVVGDTGCGMDEGTLERIFEPFFTTKEEGQGTGLGLATSYGIVKQVGGHIAVQSAPGEGSTFTVLLPRSPTPVTSKRRAEVTELRTDGSETVLVAEDKRAVRELSVRALRSSGYRVLQAENGEAALRLLRPENGPIHLLLSDVVMPRMGGAELARRFLVFAPDARVLLMSGYADEEATRQGVLESGHGFLQKPFMPHALVARIRQILDAPAAPAPRPPRDLLPRHVGVRGDCS